LQFGQFLLQITITQEQKVSITITIQLLENV